MPAAGGGNIIPGSMSGSQIRKAPRLRPGDAVRLVAPAGPFSRRALLQGKRVLERFGLKVLLDREEFRRLGFLAGSDKQRALRLNFALHEPGPKAAWCIRGGYGTTRILPLLHGPGEPRVVVGGSDITALLLWLSRPGGWVTLHGPMVAQLGRTTPGARRWLRQLLFDPAAAGRVPLGRLKKIYGGRARGFLYGGNLSLLASLVGTPFLPPMAGAILFLEEVNEPAYRIDRMWNQLRQAGILNNVLGVVLGSLKGCQPAKGAFSARRVLERAVAELGVPAVSGASFGHIENNMALPLGVLAELDANAPALSLLEGLVQ